MMMIGLLFLGTLLIATVMNDFLYEVFLLADRNLPTTENFDDVTN